MPNKIMVVSDIDDTIKWSHILGPEIVVDGLDYHLAFKGMPELYTSLTNAGATIVYVTGAPDILIAKLQINSIPQKIVSTNHFPEGEIFLHQLGESTEDFKVATISKIMKDNPTVEFILVGDNGEKDVETYTRVRQDPEIGSRVQRIFIHKIYNGGTSLEPMADQYPFVTAADLAAMLYGFNFINAEDLTAVVKIVEQGMNDESHDHNLTLPFASQLVSTQIDAIYGSLPTTIDSPTRAILEDIHNLILEQAKRGPRKF
jgi:Uncharacterized conserved protein (DUF2183)